jgi:uncharacterized repeat protein (TIGR03803 family)
MTQAGLLSCTSPGTVFKITTDGTLTTVYTFCSQSGCPDGANPTNAALVQSGNGDFYGTTIGGGYAGEDSGTVFKITPSGALTTLYSFYKTQSRRQEVLHLRRLVSI